MTGQALILDIETRMDPDLPDDYWDRIRERVKAPSNYKDPVKIEGYLDDQVLVAKEKAALSAKTGIVVMIGVQELGTGEMEIFEAPGFNREGEDKLLVEFIGWMGRYSHIIGWNNRLFDLPFLMGRWLVHNLAFPDGWPRPRDYHRVVDLKELLGGSLDDWFYLLEGDFKLVNGPEILKVSPGELRTHLIDDLRVTARIAEGTETIWRS